MLSLDRPRIGLVEDDPIMGESLVQWLSVEGYEPAWWRTGAEAMAGLQDRTPDALICDMRLPDMSGEDVFRSAVPRLRDVPVLFITAYGDIDQAVRLIRAGADDYMTKPFESAELLARIEALFRRTRPGDASEPEEFTFGDVSVRPRAGQVLRAGKPLRLSAQEFKLLWDSLTPASERALVTPAPLGYRGCFVKVDDVQWECYRGVGKLVRPGVPDQFRFDPDRRLEWWIVRSAPPGVLPDNVAVVLGLKT